MGAEAENRPGTPSLRGLLTLGATAREQEQSLRSANLKASVLERRIGPV